MSGPLYVIEPAAVVRKDGGRIVVTVDGELRASLPLMELTEVVLLGPANVSTQALRALLGANVPVVFLRSDGRARGRLEPPGATQIETRRRQLALSADLAARLHIASACIGAKIHNQRVGLVRAARSPDLAEADRRKLGELADRISAFGTKLDAATSLSSLLGFEGASASAYYEGIRLLVGARVGFARRNRFESDVLNLAINYSSALVREQVVGAITAAGLDPGVSFLHEPRRARPTLAFDLMEEWRPLLVDGLALAAINLNMISAIDVERRADGRALLSQRARSRLVERFAFRLASQASERSGEKSNSTYRELLFRQSLVLRAWIEGRAETYETFRWK